VVNNVNGELGLMFRGQYTYSIDAKGRVSIPAKLRKQLSPESNETFIMKQGINKCIEVYPLDQWQLQEEKLKSLNQFTSENTQFLYMHLQNVFEDTLDSQARILIPQILLTHAGIEKDVLIIGLLDKIVLWNPAVYLEYLKSSELSYEQLAAKVMG
jgi:MraZ protein